MATIGDIVVNLDVNRKGFTSGIDAAQSKLGKFGSMAKSGIGLAGKAIGAGLAAGAAAAGAAAAVIVPNVSRAMESIDELAKKSDKLGVATENLAQLRYAAGLLGAESEDVDEFFKNMNEKVGLARFGDEGALEQFEKLGITMDNLAGKSSMDVFQLIADKVAAIEDPTMRAAALLELFGEEGYKLAGLLSQGSAGVSGMMDEAESLGVAMDRVSAAKVEAANDSISRMWTMLDGVWNTLAVQLAPSLEAAVSSIVAWGSEGNKASEWIMWGIESVVTGIGIAGDVLNGLTAVWQQAQAGASKALAWILSGVNKVAEGIAYLGELVGMEFDTSFLKGMADEMHKLADQDIKAANDKFMGALSGEFTKSLTSKFDEINRAAAESAQKVADSAASNIDVFDEGLLNQLDKSAERAKELEKAAESIFKATRTPMEQFEAKAAELQELFAGGFINEETLGRALRDARDDVFNTIEVDEVKSPNADLTQNSALQRGSQEAFARIVQTMNGPSTDSAQQKSLKEQQEQKKLLAEMVSIMRKNNSRGVRLLAANF